jgi:hypothetical protein
LVPSTNDGDSSHYQNHALSILCSSPHSAAQRCSLAFRKEPTSCRMPRKQSSCSLQGSVIWESIGRPHFMHSPDVVCATFASRNNACLDRWPCTFIRSNSPRDLPTVIVTDYGRINQTVLLQVLGLRQFSHSWCWNSARNSHRSIVSNAGRQLPSRCPGSVSGRVGTQIFKTA